MSPTSYRTAPPRGDRFKYDEPGFAPACAESKRMVPGELAKRIPKIHLHCHLEGTLRAATFVELAAKHGVPLRYHPSGASTVDVDPADPYRFANLGEFLFLFAAVSRCLHDLDDYARLAREFVEDALRQGVIYGELFVSPLGLDDSSTRRSTFAPRWKRSPASCARRVPARVQAALPTSRETSAPKRAMQTVQLRWPPCRPRCHRHLARR